MYTLHFFNSHIIFILQNNTVIKFNEYILNKIHKDVYAFKLMNTARVIIKLS